MNMKILLVDDHLMMINGMRLLLDQLYTGELALQVASTTCSAWEKVQEFMPNIIIMDIHLPDGDGIELSRQILGRFPETKIIILSAESNLGLIKEALQTGVTGYLMKENAPDELTKAIAAVLAGKTYLCPDANALVLDDYAKKLDDVTLKPALSGRELEVLRMIAEGLRMKEIADRLKVGVKTAETYRRRLLKNWLVRALRNWFAMPCGKALFPLKATWVGSSPILDFSLVSNARCQ
jgi:DNA-binding NarL/FixJ family response regulator